MQGMHEFREQWRPLTACFIGMGAALSLNPYILSIFAPYLLADFGWTRSQWALLGIPQLLVLVCIPAAGRLTDVLGVRRVVSVGAVAFPLLCVGIAMMDGSLAMFLGLYVAQTILGSTTTSAIYSRLAAENFTARRGLALAICGSAPALVAMVASPLLSAFVESHGWRTGYLVVAGYSACASAIAIALIPARSAGRQSGEAAAAKTCGGAAGVYRRVARMPAFWLLMVGCFLVNLPHAIASAQLKMVVLDQGASASQAALLVSVFAIGVTAGRFLSGIALDALPPHLVAAVGLGLPLPGLLLLASNLDSMPWLVAAIMLIGLSFGSEGDVIAYLVVRQFGMGVFSTVLGLLTATMGGAMATGAMLLGVLLERTDSFDAYLLLSAGAVTVGSLLFLALERFPRMAGAEATA